MSGTPQNAECKQNTPSSSQSRSSLGATPSAPQGSQGFQFGLNYIASFPGSELQMAKNGISQPP